MESLLVFHIAHLRQSSSFCVPHFPQGTGCSGLTLLVSSKPHSVSLGLKVFLKSLLGIRRYVGVVLNLSLTFRVLGSGKIALWLTGK